MKTTLLVPQGWHKIKLDSVCTVMKGRGLSKEQIHIDGKNPCILYGELYTTYSEVIGIIQSYTDAHGGVRSKTGDVLVPASTTTSAFDLAIAASLKQEDVLLGGDINILRKKKDDCHSDFLAYLLSHREKITLSRYAQGSTIIHLYGKDFKGIEIRIPKYQNEQSTIAEVLSTCNKAIEQIEAIIAKHKRIKQGLMQDLLTKGIDENGNIRSEKTHKFKDSRLGLIPVEWDTMPLGELSKYVGSGITPRGGFSVYTNEGVLFLRSQNVHFGGLRLDDVAYIPDHIHKRMKRSTVIEHDLLLNITGASIGRSTVVPTDLGIANVNQHVCAIRLTNTSELDSTFLATFIESWMGQRQIDRLNAGSNREGLNYEQVKAIRTVWPPKPERERIASLFNKTIAAIASEKGYLSKLYRIKRGLMQDLLSGKVRVTPLMQKV